MGNLALPHPGVSGTSKPPIMNKVLLFGRVGNDPKWWETEKRLHARFSVATHHRGPDGTEETEWHTVKWSPNSPNPDGGSLRERLRKGATVLIEGSIRTETWTTKDGEPRTEKIIRAWYVHVVNGHRHESDDHEKDAEKAAPTTSTTPDPYEEVW